MIKTLEERISLLVRLKQKLSGAEAWPEELLRSVSAVNPWFTKESIAKATKAISDNFLDKEKLESWTGAYDIGNVDIKKVGLILAGNLPLVGFHDILSVFISGHIAQVKLSDKDKLLTEYLIANLIELNAQAADHFEYVDRLIDYDAMIATGSNSSSRYFEKYFASVPHIIRKNRNAVAVIYKDTSPAELEKLGYDILSYFGLGCRNVSKVYIEDGVELARIFEAIEIQKDIINHNKYKNNYDYTYALYLMNKEEFYTDDVLILRPNEGISSRISVVHYEYFNDHSLLEQNLIARLDKIQCLISSKPIGALKVFDYGLSQQPALTDYADRVDTMKFLLDINQ